MHNEMSRDEYHIFYNYHTRFHALIIVYDTGIAQSKVSV